MKAIIKKEEEWRKHNTGRNDAKALRVSWKYCSKSEKVEKQMQKPEISNGHIIHDLHSRSRKTEKEHPKSERMLEV